MSKRDTTQAVRVIHPAVMKALRPEEVKALLAVREDLADGTISAKQLHMETLYDDHCDTAACICGHMGLRMFAGEGEDRSNLIYDWTRELCTRPNQQPDPLTLVCGSGPSPEPGQLYTLFAPWARCFLSLKATQYNDPARAVHAIDTFLATGIADWNLEGV